MPDLQSEPPDADLKARRGFPKARTGLLALAAAALVGLGLFVSHGTPRAARPAEAAPAIGGPFHLVDDNGRPVDQNLLKGRWSAVFFGYTYCPDTCPATLQALGAAARKLGPDARDLQVVFISVDPARDTPKQLKTYLSAQGLPVPVIGLTGSPAAVDRAAKAYGVYYAKSGSGSDYTVDHSAAIYLMDPQGRFNRPLAHDMSPDLIARQIRSAERG